MDWLERYRTPVIVLLLVAILAGGAVLYFRTGGSKAPLEITLATPSPPRDIAVQVSGAVLSEGVYTLKEGTRVADAIQAAGGFTAQADRGAVNLAAKLHDEDRIHVPLVGEPPASGAPGQKININSASASLLENLPSIGPVKAQAIVAYRQAHGPFQRTEDLMDVLGIGPATYEKVKDLITVR